MTFSFDGDGCRPTRARRRILLGEGHTIWLFCGSDNGGHTAAILFSLIATCQRHQVDPFAYLRDVLTRLPALDPHDTGTGQGPAHGAQRSGTATPVSQLEQLFPDRWSPVRQPAAN